MVFAGNNVFHAQEQYLAVALRSDAGAMYMHPGSHGYNLGGIANIGAGVRFRAGDSGMYNFTGDVARFNAAFAYGNGVDVLVVKDLNLDDPLFNTHIDDHHVVDTANPFAGT